MHIYIIFDSNFIIMRCFSFLLLLVITITSCSKRSEKAYKEEIISSDTIQNVTLDKNIIQEYSFINDSTLLSLTGDFNGDGIQDTLYEHYFSQKLNKEVPVPHSGDNADDYDSIVDKAYDLAPMSFMTCSNNKIDTLYFSNSSPLFGLYYIKNEGDLDGDGGDEISFILAWADYSTTNQCYITSYKKGIWVNLYSFPTWEWAADEQMDKGGLIKKLSTNKIEVKYRTDEADQATKIVDLSKLPKDKPVKTW